MTCRELIGYLDRHLEGESAPAARRAFEAHLAGCRSCREYVRTYRDTVTMAAATRDGCDAAAPPGLVEAIVDAAADIMIRERRGI